MAPRRPPAPSPMPANLTPDQMRAAIPKLERRIRQLDAFDPQSIKRRDDPVLDAMEKMLTDTIDEVFGFGTIESYQFASSSFDTAGYNLGYPTPMYEVVAGIAESKERELTNLHTIIAIFKEKLEDGGESAETKAKRSFGDLDLHPKIAEECAGLFEHSHYAEAVEMGCKVLDMLVQMKSMKNDQTGTSLMRTVFSPNKPILKFNDQTNESERSEQEGMMHLFEGAMLAFRNPRAHGIVKDHPERAVEYLSFLSMLAKSLDRTTRA